MVDAKSGSLDVQVYFQWLVPSFSAEILKGMLVIVLYMCGSC